MSAELLAIILASITMTGMIVSSWLQSRTVLAKTVVEELRKTINELREELNACKVEARTNLADEIEIRRGLQSELSQLKDDLARKNQELIKALIGYQNKPEIT